MKREDVLREKRNARGRWQEKRVGRRRVEKRWLTGWTQWQPGERINNKCKRLTSISVWLPPPPPPSYPTLEIRHLLREEARRVQPPLYLVARLLTYTGLASTNSRALVRELKLPRHEERVRDIEQITNWYNPPCLPPQSQTAYCDGVYSSRSRN